jgi:NitT/TauT family transport system substrate-binding protein
LIEICHASPARDQAGIRRNSVLPNNLSILTPAAAIGAAILASLASSPAAQAQAPIVWTHGVIEPKGDAGFSLMVSRRGFAEKRGLQVKIVSLNNGTLAHKALLSGELDSIESSPGAAILAGLRGADLKIIGCDWPGILHGLMVKSSIASVADLKGKTIAISAPGSLPDLVARALFTKFNVAEADVQTASLGSDIDRFKALTSGVVDAGIITEELMAVAPNDIKLLAAGRDTLPNYVRLCLTVSGKTIAQRRDPVTRFLAAEIEALRYAVAHREETIALTREIIETKPEDPRAGYVFDTVVKHRDIDPEVAIPMDKLDWMQHDLVSTGNLDRPGDLNKIVDPSIRADAMALAGNGK